jgi:short subunit dehydrogenase-like uncharacterized protein
MPTPGLALIYGATGYTGRLLERAAAERGLRPILCARDERRVASLAAALGLEHRVARLEGGWASALRDVAVVVNAAGPFSVTSGPVAEACLRAGVHYLDISGEVDAIEGVARRDGEARARGVMLMPSVGFDVVPSDCLALHLKRRLPGARRLVLGISGLELMSRGSARTLVGEYGRPTRIRRGGALVGVPPGSLWRDIDYGQGPRASVAVSWGDVACSHYTTGVEDVEVYFEATAPISMMTTLNRSFGSMLATPAAQRWLRLQVEMLPEGPTEAERGARGAVIVAEVEDGAGRRARARLCTPETYTLTARIASAILERALRGDLETGFQTPARVYGPDFVLRFTGVSREDLGLR